MGGLYFNHDGETHSLRLRVVDQCPGEVAVWEALVDGGMLFYFEFAENTEVWTLFEVAIQRFVEYRGSNEIITTDWGVAP